MGQSVARLVLPPLLPPGTRGEGRPVLDELVSYGDLINRRKEDKTKEARNEDQEAAEDEREEEREVVKGQKKTLDLNRMPPELAISVLRHLGATDLCLASCVWQQLASDNILWQGLCRWDLKPEVVFLMIAGVSGTTPRSTRARRRSDTEIFSSSWTRELSLSTRMQSRFSWNTQTFKDSRAY